MKKRIAILGSTGSIGTQTLDIIRQYSNKFEAEVLVAGNNADLLIAQAKEFNPNTVIIANESKYEYVQNALKDLPIKVFAGSDSIEQVVCGDNIDMVLAAMVGYAGLKPVINAIKARKTIALANKETLVAAGDLVMRLADENHAAIIPVDSEHSAIFQCLMGEHNPFEKILITASGGPFLNSDINFMEKATKNEALKHPQWTMGAKITIDSATMMNKGFEVIEAHWLFDAAPEQIEIVVHPQSVVHSMIQFADGAVKAQLGSPDMCIPIAYALNFPERLPLNTKRLDFAKIAKLDFFSPNTQKFPTINFAYEAMKCGGNKACAMNAANEIAVYAFLADKIKFTKIFDIIEETMNAATFIAQPTLDDYMQTDAEARKIAEEKINK